MVANHSVTAAYQLRHDRPPFPPFPVFTTYGRHTNETMADLYALVHREAGFVSTFTTRAGVERGLLHVLLDEPDWVEDLRVEPFDVVVAEQR